ncbi:MAG TPA: methyltransferase [Polyangiaceae bacterium]|nr:methyltransferase [Polyangiaceae bacterium]
MLDGGTTMDALFGGALALAQPRVGYRVNVDSLLLAAFAVRERTSSLGVDLGSGVGALGLALAAVGAVHALGLVEADPALAALAQQNLEQNHAKGTVFSCDLVRQKLPQALRQRAELVVCNPPFFSPGRGTPAHDPSRRQARSGSLEPFLRAARAALSGPRARAAFCYPAAALTELFTAATDVGLVPKRLRLVHPRAGDPARLALVELRAAKPGGLVVSPPLVEWEGRARSPELARIVAGRFGRNAG